MVSSSHGDYLKEVARVQGSSRGDHLNEVARVQGLAVEVCSVSDFAKKKKKKKNHFIHFHTSAHKQHIQRKILGLAVKVCSVSDFAKKKTISFIFIRQHINDTYKAKSYGK